MPLKRAIIPLLDGISDDRGLGRGGQHRGASPRTAGAIGDNTDIPGMVAALRERGVEKVESAAVLGAGATASSALAALSQICTGPVTAYVRSAARADEMRGWGERLGVDVRTEDWAAADRALHAPLVDRHDPGRVHGHAGRRGARQPRARSSTCSTSPGRPSSPPAGRRPGEPSSAASTSSSTRPYSRSSR